LTLNEVQVDEFWGFVYKKEYNLTDEEKLLEESGDMWTFTAIMPENKLIFAHLSGKRTYTNTRKFISMIRKRSDGTIPYFSSDGYEGYKEAILSVYGDIQNDKTVPPEDLCYAQVNKKIERNRCIRGLKYYLQDKTIVNTPAMEAGLTDHVWSMEELLAYPIN
jgi:IS1 family transposase